MVNIEIQLIYKQIRMEESNKEIKKEDLKTLREKIELFIKNRKGVLSALIVLLLAIFIYKQGFFSKQEHTNFDSHPTVLKLKNIGKLASLEIIISDVIVADNKYAKGIWIVKGDAILTTDLNKANFSVNEDNKSISLTLLKPKVTSPRIDHKKSYKYSLIKKRNLLTYNEEAIAKTEKEAWIQGEKAIIQAASSPEYIQKAERNVEKLCMTFFSVPFAEWSVNINWVDDIADEDVLKENMAIEEENLKT